MGSFPNHIFRTYDIRGIVGREITDDLSREIGQAFGTFMSKNSKKTIGVSCDVRPSSSSLLESLINGLLSAGMQVTRFGELATPVNYYSLHNPNLNIEAAIQITGSHNPSEYNGFKITYDGKPFFGDDIQLLYNMILSNDFIQGNGTCSDYNIITDYDNMIVNKIKISKKIKVAMDCGNAAGCLNAPNLYNKFNLELLELFCDVDGTFPNHHPDPTVDSNLTDLQKFVVENNCDIGVAFDGDADRIVAVDEKGGIIRSDILMAVFLPYILDPGDSIVYDVKCSKALEDTILKYQGIPIMWKTGHSLIKNKMKEEKAKLGGEMSGHIFFADDYYGYDDAIYVGLRLIQLLSESNIKLSEMVSDIPKYFSTPELRLDCIDDEQKNKIMDEAFKYFSSRYDFSNIDGIRLKLDEGWALIRCSNTQPVIVCRMEASTEDLLVSYKKMVLDKLYSLGIKNENL